MDDHKLDQFFRDRLSHADQSPSGAEWEAMRAMLNEDKKRKPVFWWFVGSGIFESENPEKMAKAIVQATTHWRDTKKVAEVSKGLGESMKGLSTEEIQNPQ